MSNALEEFTLAAQALSEFERQHALVLNEYADLHVQEAGAAEALRKHARSNGPEENEVFTVTVQTKMKRWYDADTVLALAPYVAEMPGVMEVNRERITQLAKAKAFSDEVITAAYREEALTPAVTIKRKETSEE